MSQADRGRGLRLRRAWRPALCVLAAFAPASQTCAQSGGGLHPIASITQMITDNADPGANDKSADTVTRLSAGLGYTSRAGLIQGRVNYALSQVLYARHDERNTLQNSLLANVTAEVLPSHGFLDLNASISQSAKSVFGIQPSGDGRGDSNTSEVVVLGLAPRWSGTAFGLVNVAGSGTYQVSDAAGTARGDSTFRSAGVKFSPAVAGLLNWSASLTHQRSIYKAGNGTESNGIDVGAGLQLPAIDLSLRASTGHEWGTLAARSGGGGQVWSLGASWTPSPRTSIDGTVGHRPMGGTYQFALSYRTPLTVWRAAASRNLSSAQSLTSVTLGTTYDLFYALFASAEPDPVKRDALVTDYLSRHGLSPSGLVRSSFLTATATINERFELSTAWRNSRSAVVLAYSHGRTWRADPLAQAADDLAVSGHLRTDDASANLSHQLAPNLGAGLGFSIRQSHGDLASQSSKTRTSEARLTGTASVRSSWSLVARRALNDTGLRSYSESSFTGTYSLQF